MRIASFLVCCLISFHMNAGKIQIPAPVFADPYYCGSCDPEIVWNEYMNKWLIFYTGRRPATGVAATCGNPIGVCSSSDLITWEFEGYCLFDGKGGKPDSEQTYWAPGVIIDGDTAHMFVTYKEDATPPWGTGGCIAHYVAPIDNMIDGWRRVDVSIGEDNCLDASVIRLSDGNFRMYYVGGINNPETKGRKTIRYAESKDLMNWNVMGDVKGDVNNRKVHGINYQEAVYVFKYKKMYYMLTDPHKGLSTYSSIDGITWKYHGQIMKSGTSKRTLDWSQARHPSVIVHKNVPYIYYHVEPFRPDKVGAPKLEKHQRYSFIQMAELECSKKGIIRK